jgi:hypothetical protein
MRRSLLALLLALSVASAGCVGAEGRKAQELLEESERAFAGLETYKLGGSMRMKASFGELAVAMHAAVDQKAGTMLMTMSSDDLPGFPEMRMAAGPDGFWVETDGTWQAFPLPAGAASGADQFDIIPFVKDVDVEEGRSVGGEAAVKITGVLDPGTFQAGFLAGLPDGVDVDASFADTRVVLFVSEATRLPLRMLIDQSFEVEGEEFTVSMDLAVTGVNEPVEIPSPPA